MQKSFFLCLVVSFKKKNGLILVYTGKKHGNSDIKKKQQLWTFIIIFSDFFILDRKTALWLYRAKIINVAKCVYK